MKRMNRLMVLVGCLCLCAATLPGCSGQAQQAAKESDTRALATERTVADAEAIIARLAAEPDNLELRGAARAALSPDELPLYDSDILLRGLTPAVAYTNVATSRRGLATTARSESDREKLRYDRSVAREEHAWTIGGSLLTAILVGVGLGPAAGLGTLLIRRPKREAAIVETTKVDTTKRLGASVEITPNSMRDLETSSPDLAKIIRPIADVDAKKSIPDPK